jgi:hypothetical protein
VSQMVLAGEDVGAYEAAAWEGVDAKVTLRDQHEMSDVSTYGTD